jgi:hypothetical protein
MAARQRAVITNGALLFRPLPQLQLGRRGTIASLRDASQSDQCRLRDSEGWAQKHSDITAAGADLEGSARVNPS